MRFQWFFGCQEIAGAANSSLLISNVVNHVGATVQVAQPIQLASTLWQTNRFNLFRLTGPLSQNYLIQVTTNFLDWSPVQTNCSAPQTLDYSDPRLPLLPRRFYRVVPWPEFAPSGIAFSLRTRQASSSTAFQALNVGQASSLTEALLRNFRLEA